jgi:ferredoxin
MFATFCHSGEVLSSHAKLIAESTKGRIVEIDAPEGAALVDLCDTHQAPIPFSCRSASCGTCCIHVLEGAEELLPPAADELDLLDVFNLKPPKVRLACQAKLRAGAQRLRVKAFHDE